MRVVRSLGQPLGFEASDWPLVLFGATAEYYRSGQPASPLLVGVLGGRCAAHLTMGRTASRRALRACCATGVGVSAPVKERRVTELWDLAERPRVDPLPDRSVGVACLGPWAPGDESFGDWDTLQPRALEVQASSPSFAAPAV